MTDLVKQLEDKKRGCGIDFDEDNDRRFCGARHSNGKIDYCPKCKEIIAIIEQAIAEIKNIQSQENERANDNIALLSTAPKGDVAKPKSSRAINGDGNSPDTSNLLQKQRQEILERLEKRFSPNAGDENTNKKRRWAIAVIKEELEQLNQPKTEK